MKIAIRMAGISAEIRKPTLSSGNRVSKSAARWKAWFYLPLSASIQPDKPLSGAFAKLRKASISSVMSVCLSVRIEHLSSHSMDFHEILYLSTLRKSVEKIQLSLTL